MPDNNNPLELVAPPPAPESETLSNIRILPPSAIEAIERAEIDIAIATAKRFPRDIAIAKRDMREMATKDSSVAESCTYAIPRAGKVILGASVRMAEVVFSCYGNLSAGSRIVSVTDEEVTCQAVCHDLQKNIRLAIEIPRNIHVAKEAKNPEAALRDAKHTTSLAALKIGFREAVFGVVPKSVWNPIWKESQEVAAGKGKSFDESVANCLAKFRAIGVSTKELSDYLEVGGPESFTTGHLQILFGILTAIEDKETTVENEFGPRKKPAAKPPEPPKKPEPEKKPQPEQKPPASQLKKTLEEDFLPDLSIPSKPPAAGPKKTESKPKETKETAAAAPPPADPVYARVAKRIEDSKITTSDFLRVMRYWGLVGANARSLEEVRLGAMRAADSDWKAVLDEIALNPNEDASGQ
jgi:hypothetical protein